MKQGQLETSSREMITKIDEALRWLIGDLSTELLFKFDEVIGELLCVAFEGYGALWI